MKNFLLFISIVLIVIIVSSCEETAVEPTLNSESKINSLNKKRNNLNEQFQNMVSAVNANLESNGKEFRVAMVEYITVDGSEKSGNTVFFNNRGNKQLAFDFVPFDERRPWSGPVDGANDNITYVIDQTAEAATANGRTAAQTDAAIESAMATWNEANCSNLDLERNQDFGINIGIISYNAGLGGSPFAFADVQHAGWGDFFGGGVLGATFTFGWIDGGGNWTDINNDGRLDCALREIYYDNFNQSGSWAWNVDGSGIDVETVALHEAGHGLSQAHFGKLHMTDKNGKFHFSPRAVMNAGYTGPQRDLTGTDNAGHCSIWGSWPNN